MSQMANVSLDRFRAFVTGDKLKDIQHDQIQLKSNGHLVSVMNTAGDKIQRFFSGLSSEGAAQAQKNREIRTTLLSAIRSNLSGGKIPDALKAVLKEAGFDLTKTGSNQSTKALSSRSIRNIITTFEAVKQQEAQDKAKAEEAARQASSDKITGDGVKGRLTMDAARSIVETLLKTPNKYMTPEQQKKVDRLLDEMIKSGANPNKVVRMAYMLTTGMQKMAEKASAVAYPKQPTVPPMPEEPQEPVWPSSLPKKPQPPQKPVPPSTDDYDMKSMWGAAKYKMAMGMYEVNLKNFGQAQSAYEKNLEEFNKAAAENPKALSDYENEMAAYEKAMQEYPNLVKAHDDGVAAEKQWAADCKLIDNGAKERCQAFTEKMFGELLSPTIDSAFHMVDAHNEDVRQKSDLGGMMKAAPQRNGFVLEFDDGSPVLSGGEWDNIADGLMLSSKGYCDEMKPGAWDASVGKGLKDIDARIASQVKAAVRGDFEEINTAEKSNSTKSVATVKVDFSAYLEEVKAKLVNLAKPYASFGELSFTTDESGNGFKLSIKSLVLSEKAKAMLADKNKQLAGWIGNGLDYVDLSLKLEVKDGKLAFVADYPDTSSTLLNLGSAILRGFIAEPISRFLAEALGSVSFANDEKQDSAIGKLNELSTRNEAPIELGTSGGGLYRMEVDPSKFGPLQKLGLDQDTKFGGVRLTGNTLMLQIGGTADEIDGAQLPTGAQLSAEVNLNGVADRAKTLMRNKHILCDALEVSTNPATKSVEVSLRGFDAAGALKGVKGWLGVAARLFAKGSIKIKFKPELDARTGDIKLTFDGVESLGGPLNWAKKKLINKYMRTIADNMLADNADVDIEPNENQNARLTLRVRTSRFTHLPTIGNTPREISPVALDVTEKGLALGLNIVEHKEEDILKDIDDVDAIMPNRESIGGGQS